MQVLAATQTLTNKSITDSDNNTVGLATLDIDGGTDIGADLADADLFIVDDGDGGTNRKMAASRISNDMLQLGKVALTIAN